MLNKLVLAVLLGAGLLMVRPGKTATVPVSDAALEGRLFVAWELAKKPTEKWFVGPGQVTPSLDDLSPQPGQEVKSLHLDLARNEKESAFFLVSGLQDAELTVAVTGPDIFAKTALFTRSREVNMLIPLEETLKLYLAGRGNEVPSRALMTRDTEELRAMARGFLEEHSTGEQVRRAMESELGYEPEVWKRIGAELGWPARLCLAAATAISSPSRGLWLHGFST